MADGGYLVLPSHDEKPSEIWEKTRERVDRFLPKLFRDVFPESDVPEAKASAASTQPDRPTEEASAVEANKERPEAERGTNTEETS